MNTVPTSESDQSRDYFTLAELKGIVQTDTSDKTDKELVEEYLAEKYGLS